MNGATLVRLTRTSLWFAPTNSHLVIIHLRVLVSNCLQASSLLTLIQLLDHLVPQFGKISLIDIKVMKCLKLLSSCHQLHNLYMINKKFPYLLSLLALGLMIYLHQPPLLWCSRLVSLTHSNTLLWSSRLVFLPHRRPLR